MDDNHRVQPNDKSVEHSEQADENNLSLFIRFGSELFKIGIALSLILITIFIILPTLFLLLGAMWPCVFSGTKAIAQLEDNVNSLVGVVSLFVGISSIAYAYSSNRTMEKQSRRQEQVLNEIRERQQRLVLKWIMLQRQHLPVQQI